MTAFVNSLAEFMLASGIICIIVAIGWILFLFFAQLDPMTSLAGAAGFILPITTLIMLLIFVFTQPDKTFPPLLVILVGVALIWLGGSVLPGWI